MIHPSSLSSRRLHPHPHRAAVADVDGAFIDGNRGGWNSGITGSCSATKRAGWAAGLEEAVSTLAHRLGPNKTLISNYPTPEALALCSGGMMERGGSSADIQAFGKKTCGYARLGVGVDLPTPCAIAAACSRVSLSRSASVCFPWCSSSFAY